ncbi:MAG: hypothetical protein JOZ69_04975 [Myxococcales bacterium]|nr:hypothetical protein [Myxococcales bacterium]
MWLEAVLSRDDLERVLRQFAPAVIRLGDAGTLTLEEPTEVALVPERGLRVVCPAKLHWPVLGIGVPVAMRALVVVLSPVVEAPDGTEALVFKLHIEHVDVTLLPQFIDDKVTARVNEELARKHLELSWRYPVTLGHDFALPDSLASAASIGLRVAAGTIRVTEHAVRFAITFATQVARRAP